MKREKALSYTWKFAFEPFTPFTILRNRVFLSISFVLIPPLYVSKILHFVQDDTQKETRVNRVKGLGTNFYVYKKQASKVYITKKLPFGSLYYFDFGVMSPST